MNCFILKRAMVFSTAVLIGDSINKEINIVYRAETVLKTMLIDIIMTKICCK